MCTNFICQCSSHQVCWTNTVGTNSLWQQNPQTMLIKVGAEKGNLLSVWSLPDSESCKFHTEHAQLLGNSQNQCAGHRRATHKAESQFWVVRAISWALKWIVFKKIQKFSLFFRFIVSSSVWGVQHSKRFRATRGTHTLQRTIWKYGTNGSTILLRVASYLFYF